MSQAPIPSNMEGDRRGSPYAWYRTAFNPRLMASGAMMGLLPPGVGAADRMTGNNVRNFADRLSGATLARNQQDTNAYMRQLMKDDPGYEQYSMGQRLRSWARSLFGGGEEGESSQMGPAPLPQMGSFNPYTPTAPVFGAGQGMMGSFGLPSFIPSMAPQPLYGTGQGMMRAQPAPLYGTGQGMMRAPQGASGGGSGGGGGGASSGGGGGGGGGSGGSSIGQRIAAHGWATRVR